MITMKFAASEIKEIVAALNAYSNNDFISGITERLAILSHIGASEIAFSSQELSILKKLNIPALQNTAIGLINYDPISEHLDMLLEDGWIDENCEPLERDRFYDDNRSDAEYYDNIPSERSRFYADNCSDAEYYESVDY